MEKVSGLSIFQQRLTRKEFLVYLLGIVIAVSGINALVKIFNPNSIPSSGFGAGPYGGKKK